MRPKPNGILTATREAPCAGDAITAWNRLGLEYTLMWAIATFYVLALGGGLYSLDHLFGWYF